MFNILDKYSGFLTLPRIVIVESMTSSKLLFSGENLTCIRGQRVVFQNISFSVGNGDILHLAGANGSGKSSLLRIMSGVLPLAEGDIFWAGRAFLMDGQEEHCKRFSFLPPDDRSLKLLETTNENLQFWAGFNGLDDVDNKCANALEKVDMQKFKNTPVRYLSAGQKRRLSLARVFLKPAPLWLLDEPLNALDARSCELFFAALDAHCANGGITVVASHNPITPPKRGALRVLEVEVA